MVFELITKMYAEMQNGFKKSDKLKSDVGTLKSDVGTLKSDVKKIGAKIDGDITPKIEALLDGYKQNSEHLTRLENKTDKLFNK